MAVLPLPLVPELRDGSTFPVRDEDGVVAEPFRPLRFGGDRAFERPRAAELLALGSQDDELGEIACAAVSRLGRGERFEELNHVLPVARVLARVARRAN